MNMSAMNVPAVNISAALGLVLLLLPLTLAVLLPEDAQAYDRLTGRMDASRSEVIAEIKQRIQAGDTHIRSPHRSGSTS